MLTIEKKYYRITFIFTLFMLSYIYYLLAVKYNVWAFLIFLILFIPVAEYISKHFMKFIISKDIHQNSIFKYLLMLMLILPIILISITIFNEYKEKDLTAVLGYDTTDTESVMFRLDGSDVWTTGDEGIFNELFDFLNTYKVKKMSDHDWDSDVSKVTSFSLTIYEEDNIVMASVHEDRLSIRANNNSGYYIVINGPINIEWLSDFNQKYK